MALKKRKYDAEYIKYGFVAIEKNGVEVPQCVAVKVSYEIAMLIAKNKKPHTIGENLVKPCIVNAVKILLGDDMAKQFKNISLSDSTVKR
ncbi:Protein ZBED8 [Trichinella sp. T6]|nr:Protein ZBED8 [Trichinella sp. T6]